MDDQRRQRFDEAERAFLALLRDGDLEPPDETRRHYEPDEIVFVWRERKTMVVLEIGDGPDGEEADQVAALRDVAAELDLALGGARPSLPVFAAPERVDNGRLM